MSLGFLDIPEDGLDPVEAASRVAKSISAAMDDLKGRGIVDYLAVSGSDEEFDARLASKGCFEVVAAVAEKHLKDFDSPTETLIGQLKTAFNPIQDAEDLRPGRCQTEGCENDAERFGVCSDHAKKVAFNPASLEHAVEVSHLKSLTPNKCQFEGCENACDEYGVCDDHKQEKKTAQVHTERTGHRGDCEHCGGSGQALDALVQAMNAIHSVQKQLSDVRDAHWLNGVWLDRLNSAYENLHHLPGSISTENPDCIGCNGTGDKNMNPTGDDNP